ncbi:MAG: hypothetical protein R3B90_22785 [Planctomycetaceae bacterium]
MDSLLDTLTNVVGILIIMLIVTQVSSGMAVERIKGFVQEISEEQLTAQLSKSAELEALLEAQREQLAKADDARPDIQLSLARQQELAASLKAELEKLKTQQVDPAKLKSDVETRRAAVEKLEQQINQQLAMIATLKARLAETPAQGAMADTKVVNLPDPRPAPQGAKPVVFCCRDGYIYPVVIPALQAEAQQVIIKAEKVLNKPNGLDCEALVELFDKRTVGDKYVRLAIRTGGDGQPDLLVNHREGEGEATENIDSPRSLFNRALGELNPQTQYIDFRVWGDSYDTYLVARNEAARQGFTAGWTPYNNGAEYRIDLGVDLKVTCIGYVKPPAPTTPGNTNPPPPADVVD